MSRCYRTVIWLLAPTVATFSPAGTGTEPHWNRPETALPPHWNRRDSLVESEIPAGRDNHRVAGRG